MAAMKESAALVERVIHELLTMAREPFQVSAAGGGVKACLVWSTTNAAIEAVVTADQTGDAAALAGMLLRQILADMTLSCETITEQAATHDRAFKVFLWSNRADSPTELSSPLSAEGANNGVCRSLPMRCSAASKRWRSSW